MSRRSGADRLVVLGARFGADDSRHLVDQGSVEGGGQPNRLRERLSRCRRWRRRARPRSTSRRPGLKIGNSAGLVHEFVIEALCGLIENVQVTAAPSWSIETDWPAIVSVPLRRGGSWFTVTVNATLPGPLPVAPDATVSHGASARAAHAQPAAVETVAEPEPPAGPNDEAEALTEQVQGVGEGPGDVSPPQAASAARPAMTRDRSHSMERVAW